MHVSVLVGAALCALATRRLALSLVDMLMVAFLALSLVSLIAASPPNMWLAVRAITLSVTAAAAYWTARYLANEGYRRVLMGAVAVAVVLAACTVLLDAYGVMNTSLVGRAPSGTFGVRNYAAHSIAVGLPTLPVLLLTTRSRRYMVGVAIGLALCVAALVLTRSRASWLATALSLSTLALVHLAFRSKLPAISAARKLAFAISIVTGIAIAVFVPTKLTWKSEQPHLDTLVDLVDTTKGTGRGRVLQYRNTLAMISHHPLFGVGPGQWHVYYPRYAPVGDPTLDNRQVWNTPARPTSDWIGITAERGIAAGAVLIGIFALIALACIRSIREGDPLAVAAVATCVAVGVIGALDCPMQMATPNYLAAVIIAGTPLASRYAIELGTVTRTAGCVLATVLAAAAVVCFGRQIQALRVAYDRAPAEVWDAAAELSLGHQRLELASAQAWLLADQTDRAIERAKRALRLNPHYGPAQKLIDLHPPTRGRR